MEFVFEILFEIYLELMMLVVPEQKAVRKGYRALAVIVATVCMLGILVLFVWGGVLLFEKGRAIGLVPMSIAVILSLAQIIAGFVLHNRK